MPNSVIAYDFECRILWATYFEPGYPGGPGAYPWDFVVPEDVEYVRRCAMRCFFRRVTTTCQAEWIGAGVWRATFEPVESERARMVCTGVRVPDEILALDERELAVCQLVAAGLDLYQIADALGVSVRTAKRAKHQAADVVRVPVHELPVWVGEMRRFLEPL